MRRRLAVGLTLVLAASLMAESAWAGIIYRNSTTIPAQGEITRVTKTEVVIKSNVGSEITVPVNDIDRLRWTDEPAQLNLARNFEQAGRLENALETYTELSRQSDVTSNRHLKADLEFLIARVTAKLAFVDPGKLEEAIQRLEDFQSTHPDFYRYYDCLDYLSRAYLAQGNLDQAQPILESLEQAPWTDYQMAARVGRAQLLILQNDIPGAIAAFDAIIGASASTPAELSRRHEAMLGKASGLMQQKQFEPALSVLEEMIEQVSPEDAALQAQAYIRQGDCLQALGRSKEALLAYLHVDILFSKEKALHAESLYQLSRLWGKVGKPERAADARATLESLYPNSTWTKRLGSAADG